ncbi:sensor histidine kinase [Zhaonella formicivorans]|uniref:sensor histidine kinase n=1 Tax=Zhaonella formicivorans TaxID=2528593 RepID=UPI0010DF0492|nr:sensor histidine kinase [Zhaonella formicivorans]
MNTSLLDKILRETIDVIERSKEQIFEIAENARQECKRVEQELTQLKDAIALVINEVDRWEAEEKKARKRLMHVSRNFNKYGEEDIKKAYEDAKDLQIKVIMLREKEKQLRSKRDELEFSYRNLLKTAERAEQLVSQVGVAMSYLTSNLQNIWGELDKLQQQKQFGVAVIKAQEEERRRVARGMHDGPAQSIANIVLRAEYCEKLYEKKPELLQEELRSLKEYARETLEDVRKIIFDLRPMDLDDLGLVPAVKRYAADFQEKYKIKVEVVNVGQARRYLQAIEVTVFRIIQEALNNARKHSGATAIRIVMETNPLSLSAVIKDDGCGFELREGLEVGHFGLRGMHEWASILQGNLQIVTAPGKGTTVAVKIPVQEE